MTVVKWTQCPWCHCDHKCATNMFDADAPNDGDTTLCIQCGEISIFDAKAWGSLRKPTAAEREQHTSDKRIFDLRWAWLANVRDKVK